MQSPQVAADLSQRLEDVRRDTRGRFSVDEVRAVLQEMFSTMKGSIDAGSSDLFAEVESLATYIGETRKEIAALRPEEIPDEHIPSATDELDAVANATEEATNSIMESAELIEAVAGELGGEYAARLSEACRQIYEACSFQDITGQRIGKVVQALKEIDSKVEMVVQKFGPDPETREELKLQRLAEKEASLANGVEFDENELLQGPQLPENANSQDAIDALFNGG